MKDDISRKKYQSHASRTQGSRETKFWDIEYKIREYSEAATISVQKLFLNILKNSLENFCIRVGGPRQVFSYRFWEIFKNIFFTEHLRVTTSKC